MADSANGGALSAEDQQLVEELTQKLRRDVNCLAENDRSAKRRALEKLRKETVDKAETGQMSPTAACAVFESLLAKPVLRCLSDSVERCRFLAVEILDKFIGIAAYPSLRDTLPYVIPSLVQRLAAKEVVETCEELRLSLSELLLNIVKVASGRCRTANSATGNGTGGVEHAHLLAPYMDDFCAILVCTLCDPFPDVKKVSCQCVHVLATSIARHFHMQAEAFVKPLCACMTHQHSKVRIVAIGALCQTVLRGPVKCIEDSLSPLGQRAFDQSPTVRLALLECIAQLLRDYIDRYSFHHRLLPLLVCGLTDEVEEVQMRAADLYLTVGAQYLDENDQELKDETDFGERHKQEGRTELQRSVGCCTLIQRNLSKIVPPLLRDMQEWTVSTRIKSASVLCLMLGLAGEQSIQQLPTILTGLYTAGADENAIVRAKALECADELGRYLPIDTLCDLVLPAVCTACGGKSKLSATVVVSSSSAVSALNILSRCLSAYHTEGRPTEPAQLQLKKTLEMLSRDEVCHSGEVARHHAILAVVDQVLAMAALGTLVQVSFCAFSLLVKVLTLATDDATRQRVHELISRQASLRGMANSSDLFAVHMADILARLQEFDTVTSSNVISMAALCPVLQGAGPAVAAHLDSIVPLLKRSVVDGVDASSKLDFFEMLAGLLERADETFDAEQTFGSYVVDIARSIYFPNLIWKAGRTLAALRAAVMGSLLVLLQCRCVEQQHIVAIAAELSPLVISGMEDESTAGRLLSVHVLRRTLQLGGTRIDVDSLHKLYPELMKRLDDIDDEIRLHCLQAWSTYFSCFPLDYDSAFYGAHVDVMFKDLLVHLDDSSSEIQSGVLAVLKEGSRLDREKLQAMLAKAAPRHRVATYCEQLAAHLARASS